MANSPEGPKDNQPKNPDFDLDLDAPVNEGFKKEDLDLNLPSKEAEKENEFDLDNLKNFDEVGAASEAEDSPLEDRAARVEAPNYKVNQKAVDYLNDLIDKNENGIRGALFRSSTKYVLEDAKSEEEAEDIIKNLLQKRLITDAQAEVINSYIKEDGVHGVLKDFPEERRAVSRMAGHSNDDAIVTRVGKMPEKVEKQEVSSYKVNQDAINYFNKLIDENEGGMRGAMLGLSDVSLEDARSDKEAAEIISNLLERRIINNAQYKKLNEYISKGSLTPEAAPKKKEGENIEEKKGLKNEKVLDVMKGLINERKIKYADMEDFDKLKDELSKTDNQNDAIEILSRYSISIPAKDRKKILASFETTTAGAKKEKAKSKTEAARVPESIKTIEANPELAKARLAYIEAKLNYQKKTHEHLSAFQKIMSSLGMSKSKEDLDKLNSPVIAEAKSELEKRQQEYINAKKRGREAVASTMVTSSEIERFAPGVKITGENVLALEGAVNLYKLIEYAEREAEKMESEEARLIAEGKSEISKKVFASLQGALKIWNKVPSKQRLAAKSILYGAAAGATGGLAAGAMVAGNMAVKGAAGMLGGIGAGKFLDSRFQKTNRKAQVEREDEFVNEKISYEEREKAYMARREKELSVKKKQKIQKAMASLAAGAGAGVIAGLTENIVEHGLSSADIHSDNVNEGPIKDSSQNLPKSSSSEVVSQNNEIIHDDGMYPRVNGEEVAYEPSEATHAELTHDDGMYPRMNGEEASPESLNTAASHSELTHDDGMYPRLNGEEVDPNATVSHSELTYDAGMHPRLNGEEVDAGTNNAEAALHSVEHHEVLPINVEVSSKGLIQDIIDLKQKLRMSPYEISDEMKKNLMDKSPIELAKEYGMYDPEHNLSGLSMKGGHLGIDADGHLTYEYQGKFNTLYDYENNNVKSFQDIGGKMFTPKPHVEVNHPENQTVEMDEHLKDSHFNPMEPEHQEATPSELTYDDGMHPRLNGEEVAHTVPVDNQVEYKVSDEIIFDNKIIGHDKIFNGHKVSVLDDKYMDGAEYAKIRAAFNSTLANNIDKTEVFGQNHIAVPFENDGVIDIANKLPGHENEIAVFLNGKKIAEGAVTEKGASIKLLTNDPTIQHHGLMGWLMPDTVYERAFKAAKKVVEEKLTKFYVK